MKIGTKSVLYGAHCWCVHPWFVAWAWWKLYGFPWDPRLWLAFFVHDLGYVGKPNMDGEEGESHPILGATIVGVVDIIWRALTWRRPDHAARWFYFTLLHSRHFAKAFGMAYSRLCVADKLATALIPAWLYLPMVRATGEIHEYRAYAQQHAARNTTVTADELTNMLSDDAAWFAGVQSYCLRWAWAHRDGREDTWTAARQHSSSKS